MDEAAGVIFTVAVVAAVLVAWSVAPVVRWARRILSRGMCA